MRKFNGRYASEHLTQFVQTIQHQLVMDQSLADGKAIDRLSASFGHLTGLWSVAIDVVFVWTPSVAQDLD